VADFSPPKKEKQRGLRCSAEKHLWRYGGAAVAVYSKISKLTYTGSSEYWSTVPEMERFLGCSDRQAREVFSLLHKEGWLVFVSSGAKHAHKDRAIVSHEDWAISHPGRCYEREARPWDGEEGDQLGKELYRISGGRLRWYANQLRALRSSGFDDGAIIARWSEMVATKAPESGWAKLRYDFTKHLKKKESEPVESRSQSTYELGGVAPTN
jgi:hypothetical protein